MRNDYIMDMIEDFGQLLQNLFKEKAEHHEEVSTVNHDASLGEAGILGIMLKRMCLAGQINQAENMLFDAVEENPTEDYFYVALDFYKELSNMSDSELEKNDFSREEIKNGMQDIINLAKENGFSEQDIY